MNIKSLLLGSAAALVAASSVSAADAVVVAEAEPAEYVRICDVYGSGYFYIPGTETCLRVGGYVRLDVSAGDGGRVLDGRTAVDVMDGTVNDTWKTNTRFSFRTWTGQETELGTLKSYTEVRFNYANGDVGSTTLNFAWVQLGGLRIGKDESAYDSFIGYAGNVVQETIIPYGIKDTNLISYYFEGGSGFSGMISLEQGSGTSTLDSYMPHVVVGAKYKSDVFTLTGVGSYNSAWEEWAGKLRLDVKASKQLSLFVMAGYGTDENSATSFYKPWTGNFAVWGGGTYKINEKTSVNTQLAYTDAKDFMAAANIAYTPVPGFTITPEIDYFDNFDKPHSDAIGAIVRFQRSF